MAEMFNSNTSTDTKIAVLEERISSYETMLRKIDEAIQICNQELGSGYLSAEYIQSLLNNENAYLVKAENSNSEIFGFVLLSFT